MAAEPGYPDVYTYTDYRRFLEDWFEAHKARHPQFSHRAFALKADYGSPSVLHNVVKGRRNLSISSARRFAVAMDLSEEEQAFFVLLVRHARAQSLKDKAAVWAEIASTRGFRSIRPLEGDAFRFLATWYYPAIRELAYRPDFRPDSAWVAARLRPAITPDEAATALADLEGMGMLERDAEGRLRPAEAALVTPPDAAKAISYRYHREMLQRAAEGLDLFRAKERYYSAATLSVPASVLPKLREEIRAFHERMIGLCEAARQGEGSPVVEVVQLNTQMLPLSDRLEGGEG